MCVSWGGSPPPRSSATPIRSSACREGSVEATSILPDFPADVCRGRHLGLFHSGSSFAGPCLVEPTVGVVWSRVFPTQGRSLPRPGCPREYQKGDASSESADTTSLRFGGERMEHGCTFLGLSTISLSRFAVVFLAFGQGIRQRQHKRNVLVSKPHAGLLRGKMGSGVFLVGWRRYPRLSCVQRSRVCIHGSEGRESRFPSCGECSFLGWSPPS